MEGQRVSSFQTAPAECGYRCGQCGNVLNLKKGQLLPPCPKCGFRQFDQTDQAATQC